MNDFTKEELQEIKRCVKYMINGNVTRYSSLTMSVNKKLQSMIDNYCKHEIKDKKMIDYEKLKIAHELTHKLTYTSYSFDCWCCTGFDSGFFYTLTFEDNENMSHEYESENIDDLITKLQELTKKLKDIEND